MNDLFFSKPFQTYSATVPAQCNTNGSRISSDQNKIHQDYQGTQQFLLRISFGGNAAQFRVDYRNGEKVSAQFIVYHLYYSVDLLVYCTDMRFLLQSLVIYLYFGYFAFATFSLFQSFSSRYHIIRFRSASYIALVHCSHFVLI